jgi:hypothetical protein
VSGRILLPFSFHVSSGISGVPILGRAPMRGSEFTTKAATPQGLDSGDQADARGATQALCRGAQVVAHGAARRTLRVHPRGDVPSMSSSRWP